MPKLLAFVLIALLPYISFAGEDGPANRVEFHVQAEREVGNDLSRVLLVVEKEDIDPAGLAREINQTMEWALRQVRGRTDIRARSGGYQTYPVYERRRIERWRGTQELTLESAEAEALNLLVGVLQARLQVRAMSFTVSEEQRRSVEESLTAEALELFRGRAEGISRHLGARDYEIVRLQLLDRGLPPPDTPMMLRSMAVAEDAPVAAEPGTSRLTVGVQAVIRLRY